MSTFTICYSGTDCYLDQSLVMRKPEEMYSYNAVSGYIPSKINKLIANANPAQTSSVTMNGCGGPYAIDSQSLPVRLWSIEQDPDLESTDTWVRCSLPPKFWTDSISGSSLEIITIAGLARMLGVTLHLVKTGNLEELLADNWYPQYLMGYTKESIAYPLGDDGMWNNCLQATAGNYCLRWSKSDDEMIKKFQEEFKKVVLLGHSRGGVSCIIAANYLAEWFGNLEIKVCTLDPVPGTGEWWPVLTNLPGKKTLEYVGIYAIDETSGGFNGVVPRVKLLVNEGLEAWDPLSTHNGNISAADWKTTSYELLYTRGRHATVPGSRSAQGNGETDPVDNNVGASGNLANAYVVSKLIGWGVTLKAIEKSDISLWITMMNSHSAHFAKMRDSNYGPVKILGKMNGWWYYNARGISSASGANPYSWMYLEAFIKIAEGSNTEEINTRRGLINMGVREKYYQKYAGTGKVHNWVYLGEAFSQ